MIITTLVTIIVLHILGYNVSNNVSDLSTKEILLFVLRTMFFVLISFSLMWLLKNYQSTQVLVQIRPIVIVLTILIGINVFGEKVTNYEMFSMSLIILGVLMLNLSNGK
jgi:multidrug transporter EmrE-like cation transporter